MKDRIVTWFLKLQLKKKLKAFAKKNGIKLGVMLMLFSVLLIPLQASASSSSENTTIEPYTEPYSYFYPSVSLQFTSGSDFYVASVTSVGTPATPSLTVSESYSGIEYHEITDSTTGVVTGYMLIPPLGGITTPVVTFNTPFYVASNISIPLTVTETSAEWTAQVVSPSSSSVSYVQFTGTFSQFRVHLYDNYLNSLVLQFSGNFDSNAIEIRVDSFSTSVYANNIRNGIDTSIYYDAGYTEGLADGYAPAYDEGYDVGKTEGYDVGYDVGYDEGYTIASDECVNPFQWILRLLDAIFSFELIPLGDKGITVGGLIAIALAIPLLRLVLDMFAGG